MSAMTWVLVLLTANIICFALFILLLVNYKSLENKYKSKFQKLENIHGLHKTRLSELSHDLRTPLNAIMGYTSLLLNKVHGDLALKQQQDLDRIAKNSERILQIVEQYFSNYNDTDTD